MKYGNLTIKLYGTTEGDVAAAEFVSFFMRGTQSFKNAAIGLIELDGGQMGEFAIDLGPPSAEHIDEWEQKYRESWPDLCDYLTAVTGALSDVEFGGKPLTWLKKVWMGIIDKEFAHLRAHPEDVTNIAICLSVERVEESKMWISSIACSGMTDPTNALRGFRDEETAAPPSTPVEAGSLEQNLGDHTQVVKLIDEDESDLIINSADMRRQLFEPQEDGKSVIWKGNNTDNFGLHRMFIGKKSKTRTLVHPMEGLGLMVTSMMNSAVSRMAQMQLLTECNTVTTEPLVMMVFPITEKVVFIATDGRLTMMKDDPKVCGAEMTITGFRHETMPGYFWSQAEVSFPELKIQYKCRILVSSKVN